MDDSERMARADRADKIISDPIYQSSFAMVREAILAKFEASPMRDTDGREHLFKMLKALNDAKGYLEQAIQDGKILIHLQDEKRRFSLFR